MAGHIMIINIIIIIIIIIVVVIIIIIITTTIIIAIVGGLIALGYIIVGRKDIRKKNNENVCVWTRLFRKICLRRFNSQVTQCTDETNIVPQK